MAIAEAKSADFVIVREFDAPRELLWKCFTEPERMKEWFGPKGSTVVSSNMDLRVGGAYHGAMRDGSGRVMWAEMEMCAPEARAGLFLVSVRNRPVSQLWRMTGDRLLPSRCRTFNTWANSLSSARRRLSATPSSAITAW